MDVILRIRNNLRPLLPGGKQNRISAFFWVHLFTPVRRSSPESPFLTP
jgi:hypothetical protein